MGCLEKNIDVYNYSIYWLGCKKKLEGDLENDHRHDTIVFRWLNLNSMSKDFFKAIDVPSAKIAINSGDISNVNGITTNSISNVACLYIYDVVC